MNKNKKINDAADEIMALSQEFRFIHSGKKRNRKKEIQDVIEKYLGDNNENN